MSYNEELTSAMTWLGEQPDTIFLGQSVAYPGNALFKTLEGVPMAKRVELPVAEELQLGISLGMALRGKVVISIFPRMDFLMCAMNQLVNHLDKELYPMTGRVLIRTCVGSTKPMHPGVQHCGNYVKGLRELLRNVRVLELDESQKIVKAYMFAYGRLKDRSAEATGAVIKNSILVEFGDLYGMEKYV